MVKTPFGYFGSKHRIAPAIWQRLGDPPYYYQPFGGSLGGLLGRPTPGRYEFVGDIDAQITNFWRAAKYGSPNELAKWADWPHSTLDLKARLMWLKGQKEGLHQNLVADPLWYDAQCAGWYAWVNSVRMHNQGGCLHMTRRKGVRRKGQSLPAYFGQLADRLKDVTIFYGDWTHLANAAVTASKHGTVAVLLDPPYGNVREQLYDHHDRTLAARCREFALAAASPRLRIAVCGYEGEARMPSDWEQLTWGSQYGKGRECIWFSPHCQRGGEAA
jgi:hypothetical protein